MATFLKEARDKINPLLVDKGPLARLIEGDVEASLLPPVEEVFCLLHTCSLR